MGFVTHLKCVGCGKTYPPGQCFTCPACGEADGILEVQYDLDAVRASLTREALRSRSGSHWRYAELLPVEAPPDALRTIGWTPLIEAPRLARALGVRRMRLKDDARCASGSFKDRASSVGVAHALESGADAVACASTGNAASSLACCAAAVGLPCFIFVSMKVPEGKLAQLLACGATVFRVRGTYHQAYELCREACRTFGWYNRNAAVNPYLVEGKKTGGLEIAEQCAADPPDWVACSVGDGCSIAGVAKGLAQMHALGLIDWRARMLGVQAAGVAPIAAVWEQVRAGGETKVRAADFARRPCGETYADSIDVPVPRNPVKALRAVLDSDGAFVTVRDEQIAEAVRLAGRHTGIFAEPAAAAAVAGVAEARRRGILGPDADVVAVITGHGLKDIAGALRAVGGPNDIDPDLRQVERVLNGASAKHEG